MVRLRCSECDALMDALRISPPGRAPVLLDACFRCGGIWFDEGELAKASKVRPKREPEMSREKIYCPRCSLSMFDETLDGRHGLAYSCLKCKGLFVTGEGVDKTLHLYGTSAVGKQAEPKPDPNKPFDVGDCAPTCDRCGRTTGNISWAFGEGWVCRRCASETSWDPVQRAENKVESVLFSWVSGLFSDD